MSIVKVANKAGCSFATVSRVINGHPSVSLEMATRVRRVMKEIGYEPPAEKSRRGPRRGSSRLQNLNMATGYIAGMQKKPEMLLMLIPAYQMKCIHSSYLVSGLQAGIEEIASEHGISLSVGAISDEGRMPPAIKNGTADGIFVVDSFIFDERLKSIRGVPHVFLMTPPLHYDVGCDVIGPDNVAIGRMAAEYLLSLGHKDLAVLNPYCLWSSASERVPSFMATAKLGGAGTVLIDDSPLKAENLDDKFRLRKERDQNVAYVIDRFLELSPRPTGIFIVGDRFTAQIQKGLSAHGLKPGRDVTVVSCNNDLASLAGLDVRPATFDIKCGEIGRTAFDVMLARMAGLRLPQMQIRIKPDFLLPDAGIGG